jgi:hypothetical protein
VKHASYVTALVVIGAVVVTWPLGLLIDRIREPLAVVRILAVRVGVGVILVLTAARAAIVGGLWLVVVPVAGVLALWSFVVAAGIIWGVGS